MTIQTDPQYKLRMPPELHEKLKAAAKDNHRSMNAEIVARLQSTFGDLRPYGELLDEDETEEEVRALQARIDAMEAAATTLLGESRALALARQKVLRNREIALRRAQEESSKSDKQGGSD